MACFWGPFPSPCFPSAFRVTFLRPQGVKFVDFVRDVFENLAFDNITKKTRFGAPFWEPLWFQLLPLGASWVPLDRSGPPSGLPRGAFWRAWRPQGWHWDIMDASGPVSVPLLVLRASILGCFGSNFGVGFSISGGKFFRLLLTPVQRRWSTLAVRPGHISARY